MVINKKGKLSIQISENCEKIIEVFNETPDLESMVRLKEEDLKLLLDYSVVSLFGQIDAKKCFYSLSTLKGGKFLIKYNKK